MFLIAIARAFFVPTRHTSRLPLVIPVYIRLRCSIIKCWVWIGILKDFPDAFGQLARTDVSIKVFEVTGQYGETDKFLKNEIIVKGYRAYPSQSSQAWFKTQYGSESAAEYRLIFRSGVLESAGIDAVNHDDLICFGDKPGRLFQALTPLCNFFPYGNHEVLKTILVKEKAYKKQYTEVK